MGYDVTEGCESLSHGAHGERARSAMRLPSASRQTSTAPSRQLLSTAPWSSAAKPLAATLHRMPAPARQAEARCCSWTVGAMRLVARRRSSPAQRVHLLMAVAHNRHCNTVRSSARMSPRRAALYATISQRWTSRHRRHAVMDARRHAGEEATRKSCSHCQMPRRRRATDAAQRRKAGGRIRRRDAASNEEPAQ